MNRFVYIGAIWLCYGILTMQDSKGRDLVNSHGRRGVAVHQDTIGNGRHIDTTLRIAFKLRKINFDSAINLCESVYSKVINDGKRRRLAVYYVVKGAILQANGRVMSAVTWLNKARGIADGLERDPLQLQITNHLLGSYIHLGQFERALKYGLKLQAMSEEFGDSVHAAIANVNLGLLYYKMRDATTALKYNYRALSAYGARTPAPVVLLNMGLCHNQLGNIDSAFFYYAKIREGSDVQLDRFDLLQYHNSMAVTLIAAKKFHDADLHLSTAIVIANELGDYRFLADNMMLKGIVCKANGHLDDCITWLSASEKLCMNNGIASVLESVYRELVEVYRQKGNFEQALIYQKRYLDNWTDLYGEDVMVDISLFESEFNERRNTERLLANHEMVELGRDLWQKRNSIVMAGFAVLGLLIVVVIILIRISRRQRKSNEIIETEVRYRTDFLETDLENALTARNLTNQFMQNAFGFISARIATVKGCIQLTKMSGNLGPAVMGSKPIEEMERRLDALKLQIQMKNGTPSA